MDLKQRPAYRPQRMSLQPSSSLHFPLSLLLSQSDSPLDSTAAPASALKPLTQAQKPVLRYAARLSLSTILTQAQLKMLPRYSSEPETLAQNAVNLSTDFQPRKTWIATEKDLDALDKLTKPRKPRNSVILHRPPSLLISETLVSEQSAGSELTRSISFEAHKRSSQPRKLYINLPKLPFGHHLTYNEETDIRNKIVSRRWKAWKRDVKPLRRVANGEVREV